MNSKLLSIRSGSSGRSKKIPDSKQKSLTSLDLQLKDPTGSDMLAKSVKGPTKLDLKAELLKAYYDVNGKITECNIEELFFKKYNIQEPIVKGLFKLTIDNFSEIQKIYPLNKKMASDLSLKKKEYNKLLSNHSKEVENIKNYYGAIIFYLTIILFLTNIGKIWSILGYLLP